MVEEAGPLARAWQVNHEVTLALLAEIPEVALADRYSPRTRTVAAQFAHLHYLRVRNLEQRGGPAFLGDLESFPRGAQPSKEELATALRGSGSALGRLVARVEAQGRVKSWGGPPATWLAYLVAHESHHRALAIVALRLAGHKLPSSVLNNLWYEWRRPR